jgi:hypothetical protein
MPKNKEPRKVRINFLHKTYFIEYVERKARGWHLFAQFDSATSTLEEVKEYIRNKPQVVLVEE